MSFSLSDIGAFEISSCKSGLLDLCVSSTLGFVSTIVYFS